MANISSPPINVKMVNFDDPGISSEEGNCASKKRKIRDDDHKEIAIHNSSNEQSETSVHALIRLCQEQFQKKPVFEFQRKRNDMRCIVHMNQRIVARGRDGNKDQALAKATNSALCKLFPEKYSTNNKSGTNSLNMSYEEYKKIKVDDDSGVLDMPNNPRQEFTHKSPLQALRELAQKRFPASTLRIVTETTYDDKYTVRLNLCEYTAEYTSNNTRFSNHRAAQILLMQLYPEVRYWYQMVEQIKVANSENSAREVLISFKDEWKRLICVERNKGERVDENNLGKWKIDYYKIDSDNDASP